MCEIERNNVLAFLSCEADPPNELENKELKLFLLESLAKGLS